MFKSIWLYVVGSLTSLWIFARSLFLIKLELPSYVTNYLLEQIQSEGKALEFTKEYVNHRLPQTYSALVYYKKCIFSFSLSGGGEGRKPGGSGPNSTAYITCFRWHVEKILPKLTNQFNFNVSETKPGIYIVQEYSAEKVGTIDTSEEVFPYLEKEVYDPLENDIQDLLAGKRKKIGALLHGTPGNGKSFLIRYFAIKYNLPIYIFVLQRELDNTEIIKMFNNISAPGIVLFEDFDCYFDNRKSLLEKADFTFDSIINGIDGLYCDTKGLIYFLTTNNLENVDVSLKERPSRFKYIINIANPSEQIRRTIFDKEEDVERTKEMTLDECLREKEIIDAKT